MTDYGYCIFQIQLKDGRKDQPLGFNEDSLRLPLRTALDDVVEALQSWGDEIYYGRFAIPRDQDAIDVAKKMNFSSPGEKAIRFINVSMRINGRIDMEFEYGTPGSHELAMAESKTDNVPLADKAPGYVYRASLLPAKDRSMGFLIGESRGRTIPAVNALRMASIGMRRDLIAAAAADPARYWDINSQRVPFVGRLPEILETGQVREIELTKFGIASSGKRRPPKAVTVRQRGIKVGGLPLAKRMMKKWINSSASDLADPERREAELESANDMLEVKVTPEDYDEVGFVVEAPGGKTVTLSPSTIVDIFIFPVKDNVRPSSFDDLSDQAKPHIKKLASSLKVDVDW